MTAGRDEERVLCAARELGSCAVEVHRHEMRRLLAERNDAVLRAFALAHVHELLLEVDVAEVEPDGFGASQSRGVDELHERAIAHAERSRRIEAVDDAVDFLSLRRVRQPARPLRRETRIRHRLRSQRVPHERADRDELARDGRRGEPAARAGEAELGDPVGEHADVDVLDGTVGAEPAAELTQVGGVGPARPVRDTRGGEKALRCRVEGHDLCLSV